MILKRKARISFHSNTNLKYYCSPNGALGIACLIEGYFVVSEIMRSLFTGTNALLTKNMRFDIDFLTVEQYFGDLEKFNNCEVCGKFYE